MELAMPGAIKVTRMWVESWISACQDVMSATGVQSLYHVWHTMREKLPSAEQALHTRQFLQCLGLLQAVTVYSMQALTDTAAGSSSSSQASGCSEPPSKNARTVSTTTTSSSSSSSSSHGAVQGGTRSCEALGRLQSNGAPPLWHQARSMQSALTSSDYRLLGLLGTNSKALLWAAVSMIQDEVHIPPAATAVNCSTAQLHMLEYVLSLESHQQLQQAQSSDEPSAQQHQLSGPMLSDDQLHLQLASLQLRCAAKRLLQCDTALVHTAFLASNTSCIARRLWHLTHGRLASHPLTWGDDVDISSYFSARPEPAGSDEQKAVIAAAAELLPAVLQLLSSIHIHAAIDAAPATAAGVPSSSSSSSNALFTLQGARANLIMLLCTIVTHSVFVRASDRACPQPADAGLPASPNATMAVDTPATESLLSTGVAGRHPEAAFIPLAVQQFAPEVVTQLEAYIRSVEADHAAGTPPTTEETEALIHAAAMCVPFTECGKGDLALLCSGFAQGSKKQKWLYSLMFTLSKFGSVLVQQPGSSFLSKCIPATLAQMAAELLQLSISTTAGPPSATGSCIPADGAGNRPLTSNNSRPLSSADTAGSAEGPTGSVSDSGAAFNAAAGPTKTANSGQSAAGSASAASQLPSLVLIGLCCLQWTEQLQGAPKSSRSAAAAAAAAVTKHTPQAAHEQQQQQQAAASPALDSDSASEVGTAVFSLEGPVKLVQEWLRSPDISAQLSAAGYYPRPLSGLRRLGHAFLAGTKKLKGMAANSPAAESLSEMLLMSLEDYGFELTAFAIPGACNSTGCFNFTGPTERSLVSGRSCKCAGCHTAYYCSSHCQRQHWKLHKPVCKALAKAAAATAAAATACQADTVSQAE